MIQESYALLDGEMLLHTGRSLSTLTSIEMVHVGLYALYRRTHTTKEEGEAEEKLDGAFNDAAYERTTGLPAFTRHMGAPGMGAGPISPWAGSRG